MTDLLPRLFIRDYQNSGDPAVRSAYGKLAGIVGIVCNVLLFAAKLIIGLISGSVSITADAVNNLSDASGSVVTLLGFKLAEKPADKDHPYGHARMEYLSGLTVAVLILLIGLELAKSSFHKILHPSPVQFSTALVVVLDISILVKIWLAHFNRRLGRRIDSETLTATAADSRNDVLATAAVLLACVVSKLTNWAIDGYAGFLVALFILWSGMGIIKDTVDPLLGEAPNPDLVRMVGREIGGYDKVLGLHDLMVHDYGPGRRFASVHVEMDSREDPLVCHEIIDGIERDFLEKHNIHLVVHYDPLVMDDEELNHMRALVEEAVQGIDPRFSLHDFRMVRGPSHTNLIFDLAIPYEADGERDEILKKIDECVQFEDSKYHAVVTFDDFARNE